MLAYGPALDPARCSPRRIEDVRCVLLGTSTIRLVVETADGRKSWLDFHANDRDRLFALADEIKRTLAEPMGGA